MRWCEKSLIESKALANTVKNPIGSDDMKRTTSSTTTWSIDEGTPALIAKCEVVSNEMSDARKAVRLVHAPVFDDELLELKIHFISAQFTTASTVNGKVERREQRATPKA